MSQGSVATRLMRGKIFSEQFIAEFAKKNNFENLSIFDEIITKT